MDPSNTEQKAIDKVIEDSGLETIFLSLDYIYIYIYYTFCSPKLTLSSMCTYYVLIRANCKYWDFRFQEEFSLYNVFVIGSSGLCKRMIQSQRILFFINQRTLTFKKRLRQSPRSGNQSAFLTHLC